MKLVQIKSKKLQNLENNYHLVSCNTSFDNKFQFKNSYKYLHLKAPKGTINAKLIKGVWFWEVQEKGELIE